MNVEYLLGCAIAGLGAVLLLFAIALWKRYRAFDTKAYRATGILVRCSYFQHSERNGPYVRLRCPDGTERTVRAQHAHARLLRKYVGKPVDVLCLERRSFGKTVVRAFVLTEASAKPYRIYLFIALFLVVIAAEMFLLFLPLL